MVLEGVRVIEMGAWIAGPAAGGVLADWGADVVKLEPPAGDPMRRIFQDLAGIDLPSSPPFNQDNRGKRSIVGPDRDRAGYDIGSFWARSGIAHLAHAAGLFVDIPMADGAPAVRSVASPVRFSAADTRPRTPVPRLGEHGTEVLRELGLGDDEISRLRTANVLGG